jgi:hypothetical protein
MKKLFILCSLILILASCGNSQSWKGQPYGSIFNEIIKSYDLIEYPNDPSMFRVCDKKTHLDIRSNPQDINILKKIIMKNLSFEPEKSYEETYSNDFLTWETAKYEIEIMSGRDKVIEVGKELVFLKGNITIIVYGL